MEQEIDHVLMAGYRKGAQKVRRNLAFTINEKFQSELMNNFKKKLVIMMHLFMPVLIIIL